jgi:hypothetical protein
MISRGFSLGEWAILTRGPDFDFAFSGVPRALRFLQSAGQLPF